MQNLFPLRGFTSVFAPAAAAALLALGLLASGGCKASFGKGKDGDKGKPKPYVEAVEVQRGEVARQLTSTAVLQPEREVEVIAEADGVVDRIFVEEGVYVRMGQELAHIDSEEKRLLHEQAKIKADNASRELTRNRQLFEKNILSAVDFERLEFQARTAQAELEIAKYNLSKTSIRSPIEGLVTQRNINVGQRLKLQQPLFKVVDASPMQAWIYVPEKDVRLVRRGQDAEFALDADQGVAFQGVVDQVSPVVDPATGTVKVTLRVDRTPPGVSPGAFVRVFLTVDKRADALLVPKRALLQSGEGSAVYVLQPDNKVRKAAVETGYEKNDLMEVRGGLKAGEKVITAGKEILSDGAEVQVAGEEEAKVSASADSRRPGAYS